MNVERAAVVVGGAGGIGAAVCRRLAQDGVRVIVADRNADAGTALAAELSGDGHGFEALDVTDEGQVKAVFQRVEDRCPAAVLVVLAGNPLAEPGQDASLGSTDLSLWQRTVDLNLSGTFLCIREFIDHRRTKPLENMRIVTCASLSGQVGGLPTGAAYAASKAGIIGLTRHAAAELAGSGITVNGIAPGPIGTDQFYRFLSTDEAEGLRSMVPLKRIGTPDEIAAAVAFLASPDASYVTGVMLDVNGGMSMR